MKILVFIKILVVGFYKIIKMDKNWLKLIEIWIERLKNDKRSNNAYIKVILLKKSICVWYNLWHLTIILYMWIRNMHFQSPDSIRIIVNI